MTSGGKILLGLLAIGGISLAIFHSGEAHADSLPPNPQPDPNPQPLPLPSLPSLPSLPTAPSGGSVLPPAGTPIPIPGGGSIPMPSIPGLTPTPAQPIPIVPPGNLGLPNPLTIPTLPTVPGPPPLPSAPPQSPAEVASSAPADTVAAVASLLAQEANPHWRVVPNAALVTWQRARGLTADGNLGTGTALALAKEIGTIPIIRGWPKGSYPGDGKLANYQASLQQLANAAPEPRASQLRASAARETGQGYGTPEQPILHLITIQS